MSKTSNNAIATLEGSLEELEKLVTQLERGDGSLDDALKQFERGIQLTRECQTALKEAEQKVKILTASGDLEDFKADA
jgi:exodeoxyribonuclease VII small subunit